MRYVIKLLLIAIPVFLIIDLIWLGFIAQSIYAHYLGHLLLDTPNWAAAFLFYFLFLIGMLIFVIHPAIEKMSLSHATRYGAAYGFFTYMTYDLTNYAVLKDWPFAIVPIDILWGTVLSLLVATITTWIYLRIH